MNEKIIEGIAHVNNESNNKEGTRIVVDLKRDAVANVSSTSYINIPNCKLAYGINNVLL